MLKHLIKIAFRNLRKYKTQNIISIFGLAIGFTCFAFSALWIRYEMSYDSFHTNSDRIYHVRMAKFRWNPDEVGRSHEMQLRTPYPLVSWLKSTFPEIEEASGIAWQLFGDHPTLAADLAFSNIFDMQLPEDFFVEGRTDRPVIVTEDVYDELVDAPNVNIYMSIPSWAANTNFPFKRIVPVQTSFAARMNNWDAESFRTLVLIKEGVDVKAFEKKLESVNLPEWQTPVYLELIPLKNLRHNDPIGVFQLFQPDIKIDHIRIFAIAGLLVILCSLFNHLTLFFTRVRMRLRELALRKMNGASDFQIAAMLYSDFLIVILLSLVFGFMIMSGFLPIFKEYTSIFTANVNIYIELVFYAIFLVLCGFIAAGIPVLYVRNKILNEIIKGSGSIGARNAPQKSGLFIQLIISLGMIFCSAVFIKQITFLHQTDMGIDRQNIAVVSAARTSIAPYLDRFKQIPGVVNAMPVQSRFFEELIASETSTSIDFYLDKDGAQTPFNMVGVPATSHFFDFFGIKFISGTSFADEGAPRRVWTPDRNFVEEINRDIVINATALQEMGNANLLSGESELIITGVVQDFFTSPTTKSKPAIVYFGGHSRFGDIAFRHEEGQRQQTELAITEWLRNELSDRGEFAIEFAYFEDVFDELFQSERALLTLLSIMTIACILIAVFGVYSLASLSCQQRRKEIAVRKVYGAEIKDIMNIFFRENLVLLVASSLVAFPAGYLIMKGWLENYVKQTSMNLWLFVVIFLVMFFVIVFSIFSTVWKSARENPAEVVKG